jgi:hypothetical protein
MSRAVVSLETEVYKVVGKMLGVGGYMYKY